MKLLFGFITIFFIPVAIMVWIVIDFVLLFRFDPKDAVTTIFGFWKEIYL